MSGRPLLLFLIFWSSVVCTQELKFSRAFPTVSKNYPTRILQTGQEYFYVLRHNRKAHDLTLECRLKETAEIKYFTPLRLDSVNSKYFNYAHLDYILIEHHKSLYFVFQRELNNNKSVFFKRIDSLGKTGPYLQILEFPRQAHWLNFELHMTEAQNGRVILESTIYFTNQTVKKTYFCYDLANQNMVWIKQTPIENAITGNIRAFAFDSSALYYIQVRSELTGYKRKYENHRQLMLPEFFHDSLYLVKLPLIGESYERKPLLSGVNHLNSLRMQHDNGILQVYAQLSRTVAEKQDPQLQFYSAFFEMKNLEPIGETLTPIDTHQQKRLTYYDGTDSETAADKNFGLLKEYRANNRYWQLLERKEGGIYKELLVWEINSVTGKILNQYLLPRRMLSSETWSKFPDIGEAICSFNNEQLFLYLAESTDNRHLDPNTSVYYEVKKKSSLRNTDLIQYRFGPDNKIEKKLLERDKNFDFIPIRYDAIGEGPILFYFTNGKQEKFAWLKS